MRVEQILTDGAARHGHKPAIVAGRVAYSYAELDGKSDRLAAALVSRGIVRGDRIAVYLNAGFPAAVTAFGVLKAGATLLPVDPATDADGLALAIADRCVRGIVTEARLALRAAKALCDAPGARLVVLVGGDASAATRNCLRFEDAVEYYEAMPPPSGGDADDAAIVLASGTGDGGRGLAVFSHRAVLAADPASARGDPAAGPPVSLASYAGVCRLVAAIRAGATSILDGSASGRVPSLTGVDFREIRLGPA